MKRLILTTFFVLACAAALYSYSQIGDAPDSDVPVVHVPPPAWWFDGSREDPPNVPAPNDVHQSDPPPDRRHLEGVWVSNHDDHPARLVRVVEACLTSPGRDECARSLMTHSLETPKTIIGWSLEIKSVQKAGGREVVTVRCRPQLSDPRSHCSSYVDETYHWSEGKLVLKKCEVMDGPWMRG